MPTFQNDQWQEALVSLANGAGLGGRPATIADGADVAEGTTADAANANTVVGQLKQVNSVQGAVADTAVSNPASSGSVIALLKGIITKLAGTLTISGSVTTSGTVTETNSAAVKTDLDTILIGTNKIPASPATEGGNLATIAGAISSNKMATKAASGDFADGAIATIGAQADASATTDSGTFTLMALIKRLLAKFPVIGIQTSANSSSVVIASDQAAVKGKGDFVEQASLTAGSLNADLVASTDISDYEWMVLHLNGNAYVGTLTFAYSNDNVNFISLQAYNLVSDNAASGATTTTATSGMFGFFKKGRYLRIRMTGYTSGAAQGTLEKYTIAPPYAFSLLSVAQSGTWTVQPGNTQNTTPWLIQGPTTTGTQAANTAANTVIKGSAGALWSAVITATGTAAQTNYSIMHTTTYPTIHSL